MTRNLPTPIRCLCGSEPRCPFHAPSFTGESAVDRCYREAREHVRTFIRRGEYDAYAGENHSLRRAFDLAVMAESTRRLEAIGVAVEVGLATEESVEAQRQWAASISKHHAPVNVVVQKKPLPPANTQPFVIAKCVSPGYVVVRVPHRKNGRARDRIEAAADFAHEPWAADVRYLGSTGTYETATHLYERPDRRRRAPKTSEKHDTGVDVLADIRKYEVAK